MVVHILWVVVGDVCIILDGDRWWWIVLGDGGSFWVVLGGGTVYSKPLDKNFEKQLSVCNMEYNYTA